MTFDINSLIILTMKTYSKKPWSMRERVLLTKVYTSSNEEQLAKYFPDRTYNAVRKQVSLMRKKGWTFDAKSKST